MFSNVIKLHNTKKRVVRQNNKVSLSELKTPNDSVLKQKLEAHEKELARQRKEMEEKEIELARQKKEMEDKKLYEAELCNLISEQIDLTNELQVENVALKRSVTLEHLPTIHEGKKNNEGIHTNRILRRNQSHVCVSRKPVTRRPVNMNQKINLQPKQMIPPPQPIVRDQTPRVTQVVQVLSRSEQALLKHQERQQRNQKK